MILYFIKGNPTAEQIAEARDAGARFRNLDAYHDGDFVERCSFVMGDPPEAYNHIERYKKQTVKRQRRAK